MLQPFALASPLRSSLISNPSSSIPTVEELITLEEDLRALKAHAEKRAKKVESDIVQLDVVIRKLKEKERHHDIKGKGKEKEKDLKIKREHTRTPDLDDGAPFVAPKDPASRLKIELKKKKRKREADSDGEGREHHKSAKSSSVPSSDSKKHLKPAVFSAQPRLTPSGYRIADDFSEPSTSTLPSRPIPQQIPNPGPMKPADVQDDFSKAKAPGQTAITTFYTSIESWLRLIREDELGLLEWEGDAIEPFLVPPLGKHYGEAWEDEDMLIYGHPLSNVQMTAPGPSLQARISHNANWDPSTITDPELTTDERSVGPMAERLVSALLKSETEGEKVDEPPGSPTKATPPAKPPPMNIMDLDERVKAELRSLGLHVDEELDVSGSEDQVLADLRACQRALKAQMFLNKARRTRLLKIAQERLAYQEYLDTRDVLDRQITSIYSRLQKRDTAKSAGLKKRKRPGSQALAEEKEKERERLCPASLGLAPDPSGKLSVSDQLMQAVRLRRQWVDVVGGQLKKKQEAQPGLLYGLPERSIYEGIEEDVKMLERMEKEGEG